MLRQFIAVKIAFSGLFSTVYLRMYWLHPGTMDSAARCRKLSRSAYILRKRKLEKEYLAVLNWWSEMGRLNCLS